jgi:hypothetical protein
MDWHRTVNPFLKFDEPSSFFRFDCTSPYTARVLRNHVYTPKLHSVL